MAEKQLTLNQQLALMPAVIPDSIIDFMQDFNYSAVLHNETTLASIDPEYFKNSGDKLKQEIESFRNDAGKIQKVQIDACGRDIPGAFIAKLTTEKGLRGLGFLTKLKERTILRLLVQVGEFSEEKLKEMLKNPPK